MTTKVICPKCGAEIAIPEHEYTTTGTVIGKDSNLGIIPLELAGDNDDLRTAINLLNVLKKAGVNISEISGNTKPVDTPKVTPVSAVSPEDDAEEDDIESMIKDGGYIPNNLLFRRFVMGHVIYAMQQQGGFTKWIHDHGYKYQWDMIIDELSREWKLINHHNDDYRTHNYDRARLYDEQYRDRARFFNSSTVLVSMLEDFKNQLEKIIERARTKVCKRLGHRLYKNVFGVNIFVDDIDEKVFKPLRGYIQEMEASRDNALDRKNILVRFRRDYHRFLGYWCFKQSHAWINAYKGCGAFYTLLNMVLFHGCCIFNDGGEKLTLDDAENFIREKAKEYSGEGWRMVGVLKKCLDDNPQFSPENKLREWSE